MPRKILAGLVIGLSALFLLASLAGIVAAWVYNEPLTNEVLSRLRVVDTELGLAQSALKDARLEIERTLRLVDAAEETLSQLKEELSEARALFGEVDEAVEEQVVPGLQAARQQINTAITAVQEIRTFLQQLNEIPFVSLNLPGDDLLAEIISIGFSLDKQIAGVESLAEKAGTFLKDASYLMGGDLAETRQNLQDFLTVITDYEQKLGDWRAQVAFLVESVPGWVDTACVILTVFLLWFAFSQFSLFLHGLDFWHGGDPLARLRGFFKRPA